MPDDHLDNLNLTSRREIPTVRQTRTGAVSVMWSPGSAKSPVYVWTSGAIDINPYSAHGRPRIHVDPDGVVEVFEGEQSTSSSASAPDETGDASAAAPGYTDD